MPLDANGIHQYTETETVAPFSEFMNRLAGSVSDEIGKLQRATPSLQITDATDWIITNDLCKTSGGLCSIDLMAEYTGSTPIPVQSGGNIADTLMGTIQEASLKPSTFSAPLITLSPGPITSGFVNAAGQLFLAAVPSGLSEIPQGSQFRLGATYIL